MILISDLFLGKVDVVPGCCHVATEFVCAWFMPILPRRSMLFFKDPSRPDAEVVLPVRLSFKSIVMAYLRAILVIWFLFGIIMLCVVVTESKAPRFNLNMLRVAFLMLIFAATPCLFWNVSRRLSLASYNRRERLSMTPGLPAEVVEKLLETRDWLNAGEVDAS
ncbi:MAG: hypothetical protein NVSMB14_16110 [Isosphaeraceae bacterium]